jgi:uncharacterized membrane protein YkvA (DUF1232 family)
VNLEKIKARAARLRLDALALGLAIGHPRTPWYARVLVAGLVAYVVTPVDLVPDVIPVLGIIDDLIFVPVALGLAAKLVPAPVLLDCRSRAEQVAAGAKMRHLTRAAALAVWLGVVILIGLLAYYAAG